MNNLTNSEITTLVLKIVIASLCTAGIMEYLKNFIKTEKTVIYSILMPFVAVGCYLACEFLPLYFIGSILTVGAVQLNYQVLVQGFKKILENKLKKVENE